MSSRLDAVELSDLVRSTYLRYLRTLLPIRDPNIEEAVHDVLAGRSPLVKGPILEATPPYAHGRSLGELLEEGLLHPELSALGHERGIPLERPLYRHQEKAIRRALDGRNIVVATGTGSGKTESFLVPIIQHLVEQREAGTLAEPGVRALLLYPMNALANDQLKRLRELLRPISDITFGRYTGETEDDPARARDRFDRQFPGEIPPKNELLSRQEMQESPPHLLLTNYAMLEFLLLRPRDHALFDGATGEHWRFVVLDEAHVYDGAGGIEVAMLLRRLKDRVSRGRPLQFIATSATVGGEGAGPQVAEFASTMFAGSFEYDPQNEGEQDVVWAERREPDEVEEWGPLPPDAYRDLLDAEDKDALLDRYSDAPAQGGIASPLAGERRIRRAQDLLGRTPMRLSEVAQVLFPEADDPINRTGELVALAASVRDSEGSPLLPVRYHLWARATEGAFVCLSEEGPHAYLTRHEVCETCGSQVFEIGSCKRCSATYLVGSHRRIGDREYLAPTQESGKPLSWFVLIDADRPARESVGQLVDEDDAVLEGLDADALVDHVPRSLCTACGALGDAQRSTCECGGSIRQVLQVEDVRSELRSCGLCGGRSNAGQIRRLTSGTDAAVSVLTTAVYQSLPPDDRLAEKPGAGRKLLLFADSRQDAAYFAPYLEGSYGTLAQRRIVFEALQDAMHPEEDPRLEDVAMQAVRVGERFGMFDWKARRTEKLIRARTWVHAELLSLAAQTSLEALGLIAFGLLRPPGLAMPRPLLDMGLTDDEAWNLVCELLRTARGQGAVSFPEGVAPDADEFQPRMGPIYLRGEGPQRKLKVLSWLPGSHQNSRTDYVGRLLRELDADLSATELLRGIWKWLTHGPASDLLYQTSEPVRGAVTQLDHELITVRPVNEDRPVYECSRCRRLAPVSVRGVCTTMGCRGQLEGWSPPGRDDDDHYRMLARHLNAVPLSASEHTAQFTPDEAARIQQGFIDGDVNVLSCSTTFELGVDVGELQTVVLRNVPPRTSNYVQRAGRAGRRTDAAAVVVTYAQRRSHDLTFFRDPIRMISGEVRPPRVAIDNDRIARRHAHATALAAYFRHAYETRGIEYRTASALFGTEGEDARLIDWLRQVPADVVQAIQRVLPEQLHARVGLDDGSWIDHLIELVKIRADQFRHDVDTYRRLQQEASQEENFRRAEIYKRVINTFERRYLLSELSSHNVLPKYGFPVDTVEMRTNHVGTAEAARLALDRDLRLAISDYAPGSEIVAGGYLWESAGVYRFPDRDFPQRFYAACTCGWYEEELQEFVVDECPACGSRGRSVPKVRRYIVPEFGFVAKPTPPSRPRYRPMRTYANKVHLVAGSVEGEHLSVDLPTGAELRYRYAERGRLVVINEGMNGGGYRICQWCGAGERWKPGQQAQSQHQNPLTGRDCRGPWEWVSLGHFFETDVLELKVEGSYVPATADVWWGLVYALVEAAADMLEISRDDVDGTLHYGGGGAPTLVLFDDVPAGAGHVRRIRDQLGEVFRAAYARVQDCECGAETSCYRCLRGFRNQRMHDQLRRGAVADLLSSMLGDTGAGDSRKDDFEEVRSDDLAAFDGRFVVVEVEDERHEGRIWVEEADGEPQVVLLQTGEGTLEFVPQNVKVVAVRRPPG